MTKNRKYHCNLIFCKSPLKKKYRFKDIFQIIPLPKEFDLTTDNSAHYPILLEYWIDLDKVKPLNLKELEYLKDFVPEPTLQNNWLNKIVRLLTVFTNHNFFIYDNEEGWFKTLNLQIPNEEKNNISSSWGMNFYYNEEMQKRLVINKLTNIDLEDIGEEIHNEYFQKPNIDDINKEITISKYTNAMFEAFFLLNEMERKYFDSAVTLIYNGQQIKDKMRSLAFLSFISSIETMTSLEFKDKQKEIHLKCESCKTIENSPFLCAKCDGPIWGVSQQFKSYLNKYLTSDPNANSIINNLYDIRSKIVHKGQLLLGDSFIDWDKNKKQSEEYKTLISLMQYSKISLIKWLLDTAIKTNDKMKN